MHRPSRCAPKAPRAKVDLRRSRKLARTIRAQDAHCFGNAFNALAYVPGGYYVEGFVTDAPMGHGWIETAEGAVLEVTPRYL